MEMQLFVKYMLILGFMMMLIIMYLGFAYMPKNHVYAGYSKHQLQREQRISSLRKEITESIVEDQMKMRIRNNFDVQRLSFVDPLDKAAKLEYIFEESQKNGKRLIRQKEVYGVTEIEAPDLVKRGDDGLDNYSEKINAFSDSIKKLSSGKNKLTGN